ncbi:MAG TPA: hypothetical protein VMP11_10845 [Verrucomicrobiae bacterium]|nr:hypothetical protein [Verrucomicrobiae bacterium]
MNTSNAATPADEQALEHSLLPVQVERMLKIDRTAERMRAKTYHVTVHLPDDSGWPGKSVIIDVTTTHSMTHAQLQQHVRDTVIVSKVEVLK